jgi:hypothetical protein
MVETLSISNKSPRETCNQQRRLQKREIDSYPATAEKMCVTTGDNKWGINGNIGHARKHPKKSGCQNDLRYFVRPTESRLATFSRRPKLIWR